MEDTKLLLRLLHKDPSAGMEQLMNQYAGLVYAVVKGKLAGSFCVSSDIEDCVADVFSEFYADLSKYDPKISSIKSYLCVLARNNAIDIIRKYYLGESSKEIAESLNMTVSGVDTRTHRALNKLRKLFGGKEA